MRGINPHEWAFTDWVWGPTALFPEDEPELYKPIPHGSVKAEGVPEPV